MVTARKAKGLLAIHGRVRSQEPSLWKGPFPIPLAVEQFYREVGPVNITIEAYGNPYFLPSLAELWEFQAGYRWNGLNNSLIDDWNDDWLVVADEGGDPFIFLRSTDTVLHAIHGQGEWDVSEMFPDLNSMAAGLAQLGQTAREAGDAFLEEDCSIRPEFREIALGRIGVLIGSKSEAESILGKLGWG